MSVPQDFSHLERYLGAITPSHGDPTYSLLKAHLLIEDLLRSYLAHTLPHAQTIEGARLSFAQLLAVTIAVCPKLKPDDWIWKAIADLNRLRNLLAHSAEPTALAERIWAYTRFIVQSTGVPFTPSPAVEPQAMGSPVHILPVDMATIALYYCAASALGFSVDNELGIDDSRSRALTNSSELPADKPQRA